jgi:hypothetical protein
MQRRTIQSDAPKTCATFYGPHSLCAGHDMNRKPKSKIANLKCDVGRVAGPSGRACCPQRAASIFVPFPIFCKTSANRVETPFCQKILRRASACTCAHRRAPTRSGSRSSKNMCDVLLSAQLCRRPKMKNKHQPPRGAEFRRESFGCGEAPLSEHVRQRTVTDNATLPWSKRSAGKTETKPGHSWDKFRGSLTSHANPKSEIGIPKSLARCPDFNRILTDSTALDARLSTSAAGSACLPAS